MADSEKVYTSRQVANELGITQQMLSKYTNVYLQLTGIQIAKRGRLGREYSTAQFETLKNARDWVRFNTGATVEEAVRRAVTFADTPLEVPAGIQAGTDLVAFRIALREEVAGPIVEKLEALQREVEALKASSVPQARNIQVDSPSASEGKSYSLLVRYLRRFLHIE